MYYPCCENKGTDHLVGTVKLICVFIFAYADCWFSHEAAHFMNTKAWLAAVTSIAAKIHILIDHRILF